MTRLLIFVLCACACAPSQTQVNYIFHLDSGALIVYQVYSEVRIADGDKTVSKAEFAGNRIRRVLVNGDGIPWLGFEVHVEEIHGQERFRLSVEPIAGVPFFASKPASRMIENADRILLEVLEQPSTGKRLFDTFQVGTKGTPMQIMPMARSVPQVAQPEMLLRLESPKLIEAAKTLAESRSTETASRVGVQAPKVGQFLFSTRPAPGYRMEGIADGNFLRFVTGDKQYDIACASPVVNRPGAWYVWVKAIPAAAADGDGLQLFVP